MRKGPIVHIPEDMVTKIDNIEDLTKMVLAWNTFDTEFLKRYFDNGGKPYIAFPYKLTRSLSKFYAVMICGSVSSAAQKDFVVPLPSLTVRRHFVEYVDEDEEETAPNMRDMEAYNSMLDMCLEHGLSIDACDSLGMTILNISLSHFTIFSKLLSKPKNNDWWKSDGVDYSVGLLDYSVAGILLNRGIDPFRRTGDKNYSNTLCQAADGAYGANHKSGEENKGNWASDTGVNLFYADVLFRICSDAPHFTESPFPIAEQCNILKKVIAAGFVQIKEAEDSLEVEYDDFHFTEDKFKFIPILESLLEKKIVGQEALQTAVDRGSLLYDIYEHIGKAVKHVATLHWAGTVQESFTAAQNRYNAVKDYSSQVLTTLQRYGVDINHIETSGKLSASGLVMYKRQSFGFSEEFYRYLLKLLKELLSCGFDPSLLDKDGYTLFDYYPNKRRGQTALELLQAVAKQLQTEKAAYEPIDELYMRRSN